MNFQKCTISLSRLIHFHYLPIYLVIPLNSVLNYQGGSFGHLILHLMKYLCPEKN